MQDDDIPPWSRMLILSAIDEWCLQHSNSWLSPHTSAQFDYKSAAFKSLICVECLHYELVRHACLQWPCCFWHNIVISITTLTLLSLYRYMDYYLSHFSTRNRPPCWAWHRYRQLSGWADSEGILTTGEYFWDGQAGWLSYTPVRPMSTEYYLRRPRCFLGYRAPTRGQNRNLLRHSIHNEMSIFPMTPDLLPGL